MDYNFTEIEKKWQQYWRDHQIYKVDIDHSKPSRQAWRNRNHLISQTEYDSLEISETYHLIS